MVLGDKSAAGDVVQDTFIRLYEQQNHNPGINDVKSWLFITARNLCFNIKRHNRQEISLDISHDQIPGEDKSGDERVYILEKAMQMLDSKFREALALKEYQGLSYAEMATVLETTVPAVKSLLFRARVSLREKYNQQIKKGERYGM